MKKVIFICIISLSMCLSAPTDPTPAPSSAVTSVNSSTPVDPKAQAGPQPAGQPIASTQIPPIPTEPSHTAANGTATKPAGGKNDTKADSNKTKKEDTQKGKDGKGTNSVTPPPTDDKVNKTANGNITEKPANGTTPNGDNDKKAPTTTIPETPTKPTETPSKDGELPLQTRRFDGPSFFGGIVLALGLLAIGYIGLKYYKNQTERNYHTL